MKKTLKTLSFITAVFADISIELNNYDVDTVPVSLADGVDYVYTGLYKPFRNLYVEIQDNTVPGVIAFEYFNGLTWESLSVIDQTKNLSRSGFMSWELPADFESTEVNGEKLFYIRFSGTVDVTLVGLNMVFANDNDLKERYRSINEYLGNDKSFIAYHQSSRNDIIQTIRNSGNVKVSSIDNQVDDLIIWDFLRPDQLRNAAAYLCMSKIFAGVSDNSEGKFFQLSNTFKKEYRKALGTFLTTIDRNDDGIESPQEQNAAVKISTIRFV